MSTPKPKSSGQLFDSHMFAYGWDPMDPVTTDPLNKEFKPDTASLIYRGPWILDSRALKTLALYSLFFSKVYVSSYTCIIPSEIPDYDKVIEGVIKLCQAGVVEPFHVTYHSYLHKTMRWLFPYEEFMDFETLFRKGSIPNRSKLYRDGDLATPLIPLIATAHEFTDENYIEILRSVHRHLSRIRLGSQNLLYKKTWKKLTAHWEESLLELQHKGWKQEACLLEEARSSIPLPLIDYAYYVNLSLHWSTMFRTVALSCHPLEYPIYQHKMSRQMSKAIDLDTTRAIEASFAIPFFPDLEDVPITRILKLGELHELDTWRQYIQHGLAEIREKRQITKANSVSLDDMRNWLSEDLWRRVVKELWPIYSPNQRKMKAAIDTGVQIVGTVFPPLNLLGFIGPATEFYSAFKTDNVVMFALKATNILSKGKV